MIFLNAQVAFVVGGILTLLASLFAALKNRPAVPGRNGLTLAWWAWALLATVITAQIYGFREVGGDTEVYHQALLLLQEFGYSPDAEWLFDGISWILLQFMSVNATMIAITMGVCFGVWLGIARYMRYYPGALAATAVMFTSFYCVGIQSNIIRHGLAVSMLMVFLPELLRADKGPAAALKATLVCGLAAGFHNSVYFIFIPCLVLTHLLMHQVRIAIAIALIASVFSMLGIGIERLPFVGDILLRTSSFYLGYLESVKDNTYYRVGFRAEFFAFVWAYALWGIYAWAKLGVRDRWYEKILILYLLCQSVFVCSFNIPFSDRVGLFCFVLIPLLVCYPFGRIKALSSTDAWLLLNGFILSNLAFTLVYFSGSWI